MADKNEFSKIPIDFCQQTASVSCQSSKTLHNIMETLRCTLENSFDDDVTLSDAEKGVKKRFWQMLESAVRENTAIDGERWSGARRDTLDFSPLDSALVQKLSSELPRKTNDALTTLAHKRKTVPDTTRVVHEKRLKLRRRYLDRVECEVGKTKGVQPPLAADDRLFSDSQRACQMLATLMQHAPTSIDEAHLVNQLYKTESALTSTRRNDVTTRMRRPSAKSSRNTGKTKDDNENLIKDLHNMSNGVVDCGGDGAIVSLRRRKEEN